MMLEPVADRSLGFQVFKWYRILRPHKDGADVQVTLRARSDLG